jgi:hypothetical protein
MSQPLKNETIANTPIDTFHWDPTTVGWADNTEGFRAYETRDCNLNHNGGQHIINWKGKKKMAKPGKLAHPHTIKSYKVFLF